MIKKLFTILCFSPLLSLAQLGCGDTFTDSGDAAGDYLNNSNITYTICPDVASDPVTVTFTSFSLETDYDYLTVYNGSGAGAALIGSFTGSSIDNSFTSTAANGCLTFVFTSDGSVTDQGWVANVTCPTTQPNVVDLVNVRSYNGNVVDDYDYTMIPNSQRKAMTFGAKVGNLSSTIATDKTMSVTVNDGTTNVFTGSQTFTIAALDTQYVWLTTNFTPAMNKTFTVTVALGADDNLGNNTKTFTFQTQSDLYAHDFQTTTTAGISNPNTEYYFVNNFFGHGNGTVYSVDVKLAPGTTANQTLRVFMASTNGFLAEGTKLINSADVANGQYTRIYLDNPVTVSNTGEGFYYYIGVGSPNLTSTLNIYANSNNNDDNGSNIIQNGNFVAADKTFAVRMNFNQGCAGFSATNTVVPAQSCTANSGKINLSVSVGGNALNNQNNVSWTGSSTGSLTNQPNIFSISNLPSGTYFVTITNNGCSYTTSSINIGSTQSPTLAVSETSPISCFGNADGAITYTVSGNSSDYNFMWSNGSSSTSLSNLAAGVYTISATNGVCNLTQSINVENPAPIAITATKSNVTNCGGSNGSIQLSVTGGTSASYLYTWTGPSTGSSGAGFGNSFTINDLSAGNYIVTVTNGSCVNTTTVSIGENSTPTITVNTLTPISCPGMANGVLKVTSNLNINQYTFTWSNGSTGIQLNNIAAGTYSVVGTNGTCTVAGSLVLADPAPISISGVTGTSTITTSVTGGTGGLSYSWVGPNGFTSGSQNLSNLTSLGTYTVTVTDQNSCSDNQSFVVNFVGTEKISKKAKVFKYYPNPSSALINFEVNDEISKIIIFDYSGKLIETLNVNSELQTLNLDSYSNGIYFFNLVSKENEVVFKNKFSVTK